MMKKIVAVIAVVVCLFSCCVPAFAEDTTRFKLPLDPENRYTDISEMDEYNKQIFANEIEEEQKKEGNKIVYITILSVLLVIAVIVLILSLRKASVEEEKPQKQTSPREKTLKDEEKDSDDKKKSDDKKTPDDKKVSANKKSSKGKKK